MPHQEELRTLHAIVKVGSEIIDSNVRTVDNLQVRAAGKPFCLHQEPSSSFCKLSDTGR